MHRTPGMVGAPLLALVVGCGSLDDFEEVITDEATLPSSRVAGSPIAGMYGGDFKGLQLSKAKNFDNNGVEPGDVDAIFVKSVRLEMDTGCTGPSCGQIDQLGDYVESMTIWVEAPGQAKKTIAIITEVPETKQADLMVEAEFAPAAAENKGTGLKPYAVAPSMTVGADVVLTDAGASPLLNIKLITTITLLIDVNILGL